MSINTNRVYLLEPDQHAALRTMVLVGGIAVGTDTPLMLLEVPMGALYTSAVTPGGYSGTMMEYRHGAVVMRGRRFVWLRTIFLSRDISDDVLTDVLRENVGYTSVGYNGDTIKLVIEGTIS